MAIFLAVSAIAFLVWGWLSQPRCRKKFKYDSKRIDTMNSYMEEQSCIIEELSGKNFSCESKVGSHLPKR